MIDPAEPCDDCGHRHDEHQGHAGSCQHRLTPWHGGRDAEYCDCREFSSLPPPAPGDPMKRAPVHTLAANSDGTLTACDLRTDSGIFWTLEDESATCEKCLESGLEVTS